MRVFESRQIGKHAIDSVGCFVFGEIRYSGYRVYINAEAINVKNFWYDARAMYDDHLQRLYPERLYPPQRTIAQAGYFKTLKEAESFLASLES